MDPLTRRRQAAMLSAFHHSGEIVAPNAFLPVLCRLPSMKAAPALLASGGGGLDQRDAAVRATARGALSALDSRSRATPVYRLGNLQRFVEPKAYDKFKDAAGLSDDISKPVKLAATDSGIDPLELQPEDTKDKVEDIPGGDFVLSRNMVDQKPYLDLVASQCGVSDADLPIVLHTHDAWPDLDSFVTTVVIWLTISRERLGPIDWLDQFGRFMNPAKWATVNREYFGGSEVLRDGKYAPRGEPEEGSWTGYLSEKVEWAINDSFSSRIHNRLKIDFRIDRQKDELRLLYSLDESITSEVGGISQNGGLDVDRGGVAMWPSDDGKYFYVIATKQLRFVNRDQPLLPGGVNVGEFLNFMAPASVGVWMDNLVFQTAVAAIKNRNKRRDGRQGQAIEVVTAPQRKGIVQSLKELFRGAPKTTSKTRKSAKQRQPKEGNNGGQSPVPQRSQEDDRGVLDQPGQ